MHTPTTAILRRTRLENGLAQFDLAGDARVVVVIDRQVGASPHVGVVFSQSVASGQRRIEIGHEQDIALSLRRVVLKEIDEEIVGMGDVVTLEFFSAGFWVAVNDAKLEFNVCVHGFLMK